MSTGDPWTEAKYKFYVSCVVLIVLIASSAIALRIYVRTKITRSFGIDDVTLLASHVLNLIACGIWLYMRRRAMYIPVDSEESYEKLSLPAILAIAFYVMAGIMAKIAVAFWFLATARSALQRSVILVPLGLYLAVCGVAMFIVIFRCGTPVSVIRILNTKECAVGPQSMLYSSVVVASLNSLCDVAFAAVPLHMVITAKSMDRSSRIMASALIGIAVTGGVFSIARLPLLGGANFGPDFLGNPTSVFAYLLSLAETAVTDTTVSLATLQPLVSVARKRWQICRTRLSCPSNDGPSRHMLARHAQSAPAAMQDMLNSWDELYSQTQSEANKAPERIDSYVVHGIGILPDITLTADEEAAYEAHPHAVQPGRLRRPPLRLSRSATTILSIEEVMYSESKTTATSGVKGVDSSDEDS